MRRDVKKNLRRTSSITKANVSCGNEINIAAGDGAG